MLHGPTDVGFLEAIRSNPQDDAPRLVYADWLDEMGDSDRAEFIRVQVKLARTMSFQPEFANLQSRSQELQRAHYVEWVNQLPQFPGVQWEVFDRGFISTAHFANPDNFAEHGAAAFEAAPILELRLSMFYWQDAQRLADASFLGQLTTLDLENGNRLGNAGLEVLMQSPHLARLRKLKIQRNALGSAGARAIVHSPLAQEWQLLDLSRNDLYDDGLVALVESDNLHNLWSLDLERTRLGDAGIQAFARTPERFPRLSYFDVSGNLISDAGVTALAGSPVLAQVRDLFMYANQFGDDGAVALANSPYMNRVEELFLHQNQIGDRGALALAESSNWENLKSLYLGGNPISDEAFAQLRQRLSGRVSRY